jgi:S1-C subfamily serine protease
VSVFLGISIHPKFRHRTDFTGSIAVNATTYRLDVTAADVIKVDQVRDLALLRPLAFPTNAPKPIELADAKDIAIGADVHAIGHPTGETWSYTTGIISQIRN